MENEFENKKKVYGLGIASFVLSILSVVTICYIVVSVILGIISIVLGILSCVIEKKNGMGVAGLIIGIVSIFITLLLYIILGVMQADILMVPDWYTNF
ncbi:MAG: DUF4190 domain-containing protein [Clostridia bacterium]|nr:DUF4190 domain-containing protein [Clostridia bacterium]